MRQATEDTEATENEVRCGGSMLSVAVNPLWAITRLKPENLHYSPRIRHRRPFLYLAPCGGEW
jgi:hypothetical protein